MSIKSNSPSNVIALNRSLKDKEIEIELLQQTFTAIGSELNLDKIFELVSKQARALINADTLLIPLLDENCETYTYRGGDGKNAEEIVGESLPLNFGVCGWVWKHKKPWWQGVLKDLSRDEKIQWEEEAGTMIMVPLQGQRHFLGGIAGINKTGGREFTKRDLNLLQMFASIVSIAIENAMSVNKIEESIKLNEEYKDNLELLNKQLLESNKELEQLTLYDTITSLPNRSLFHDRFSRNIGTASLNNEVIALLLIDLNQFKVINDALGHSNGDLLLNKVANRFEENILAGETLARLGGDEFVIILPNHDENSAEIRAKQIQTSLHDSFVINQTKIAVGVSIGISLYPDHGPDVSTMLSHADSAMYAAKDNNLSVYVYDPIKDLHTQHRLSMVVDIRNAVENKQFELHYQPKINIKSKKLVTAEALGRWTSEVSGVVSPNIFIQVLEQNSLIDEYTYWVIETALKQSKRWQKHNKNFRLAVNISPQTLMNPEFIQNLEMIIRNKSDGECLIFEITENLFFSDFDRLSEILECVCDLGVEWSIDDYGTGYSSLSRLRRLPVKELKIDQSFIKEMINNKDDQVIVHSTIELAHNLGLNVVAEGVETQQAFDLLHQLGCDVAQGYLISKPLALDDFDAYIQNQFSE